MQTTLIAADNTLLLWAFLMLAAAAAIVIEQNVRWAAKIPGAVIALLIALAASNFGLVPADAPVYDAVWGYVVPLAVPLLLFQLDLHAVFKESGRLLLLFLISSAGTMAGRLPTPAMLTPWWRTTLSAFDSSQLPPCSTAMSTTTEPGRMDSTMARVTSTGALRPGMRAVVITTSA